MYEIQKTKLCKDICYKQLIVINNDMLKYYFKVNHILDKNLKPSWVMS